MKKFVSFNVSTNASGAPNIDIAVLNDASELIGRMGGGYIESNDLDDLETPAEILVAQLLGYVDDELVAMVAAAFREILKPEPVPTVSINGNAFDPFA